MPGPRDKAEAKERPKKPPGYRKFAKLLKEVISAPPLRGRAKGGHVAHPLKPPLPSG